MTRKRRRTSRRRSSPRNPFARALGRGAFRQRRKPSAKIYRRRRKHPEDED